LHLKTLKNSLDEQEDQLAMDGNAVGMILRIHQDEIHFFHQLIVLGEASFSSSLTCYVLDDIFH